ncbi:MAG: hypothetical protein JO138_27920 [Acidobacteriaceae bacterium]|nr:hypothetical protein [Acidobacteriaceae bacterium]
MQRIYLGAILLFTSVSIIGAQVPKAAVGISPIPVIPSNGDISQFPKDYIFFDLHSGEYVVSYPTDFSNPEAERITKRFGVHSLTDPQITFHITANQNGSFQYVYQITNGPRGRQQVEQLTVMLPADDESAQVEAGTWTVNRTARKSRDTTSPLTPLVPVEVNTPAPQATTGAQRLALSIDSQWLPGFAPMMFRGTTTGKEYTPAEATQLPSIIQDKMRALFTPAFDGQTRTVLLPRFRRGGSQFEMTQNLLHGIDVLMVHGLVDRNSVYLTGARTVLKNFLLADGTAPITPASFASLPQPKPGLESEIATALKADFAP